MYKSKVLTEDFALELMREGRPLMRMHTVHGMQWFVVPGGQINNSTAEKILARPDVQPGREGLFPQCEQTFRLRSTKR
jgi:hypothetical protein